jgi:hypothetical protein
MHITMMGLNYSTFHELLTIFSPIFQHYMPGLVVRRWPLSCVGMGLIPIQAHCNERVSFCIPWCGVVAPVVAFTKSCLKQSRIFLVMLCEFT